CRVQMGRQFQKLRDRLDHERWQGDCGVDEYDADSRFALSRILRQKYAAQAGEVSSTDIVPVARPGVPSGSQIIRQAGCRPALQPEWLCYITPSGENAQRLPANAR